MREALSPIDEGAARTWVSRVSGPPEAAEVPEHWFLRAWFGAANKLSRPWSGYTRAVGLRLLPRQEVRIEAAFGRFVCDRSDHTFFWPYFDEPLECAIVWRLLDHGDVAVDVGANRGWYTLMLSYLVGDDGRVLAFEPDPVPRALLTRNIAANPSARNVTVSSSALSNADAVVAFVPSTESALSHLESAVEHAAPERRNVVDVAAERLAGVLQREGVERLDFVKIDVEGAEWLVLDGLRPAIDAGLRPCLLVEAIDQHLARFERASVDLAAALGPSYVAYKVCSRHGVLEAFPDASCGAGRNLLLIPLEKVASVATRLFGRSTIEAAP